MTVQIDIDEKILAKVDEVLKDSQIDRTEYFKKLVENDIVARQYAEAYRKNPQTVEEIEEWEEIQHWED
jgi:metal-responsive CopG/Arc/MetJ family transcriptional regulator